MTADRMEPNQDGGSAFPRPLPTGLWSPDEAAALLARYAGMSLRDYFAAKAMHAELVTCGVPGEAVKALCAAAEKTGMDVVDRLAFNAYEIADAMLRARERPHG